MPELEWGDHLIESLMEMGTCKTGDGGPVPLEWQEISAWAKLTRTEIPGNEAFLIRQLSQDYCNQFYLSKDPACPRPGRPVKYTKENRQRVSDDFKQLVRRYK